MFIELEPNVIVPCYAKIRYGEDYLYLLKRKSGASRISNITRNRKDILYLHPDLRMDSTLSTVYNWCREKDFVRVISAQDMTNSAFVFVLEKKEL